MSPNSLFIVYALAGFVVLAEALNKLERVEPFKAGLSVRERAVVWLKTLGWFALALGGAGAAGSPVLFQTPPNLVEVFTMVGFALLILRTRVGEVLHDRQGKAG